jgi:hypothetical protein
MADRLLKLVVDGCKAMWRLVWPVLRDVAVEEANEIGKDVGKEAGEKIADKVGDALNKAKQLLNDKPVPTDASSGSDHAIDTDLFPVAPSPTAIQAATSSKPEVGVAPAPTIRAIATSSEIRDQDVAPPPAIPPVTSTTEIGVHDVATAITSRPALQVRVRTPALAKPPTLPRLKLTLAPKINVGAPARATATPTQIQPTRAAMDEAGATESSSYMLLYLLGGAAVLVVVGAIIYNQQRRRGQDRDIGNEGDEDNDSPPSEEQKMDTDDTQSMDGAHVRESPKAGDHDKNSAPSEEEQTEFLKTDADDTLNIHGTDGKESPKAGDLNAGSSEHQDYVQESCLENTSEANNNKNPDKTLIKPEADEESKPAGI